MTDPRNLQEALTLLVSAFKDTPQIVGTEPDEEWKRRNAFVASGRVDREIVKKLRIRYEFFDQEFPVILNLARYWAEAIWDNTYSQKVKSATDQELDSLSNVYPDELRGEKDRLQRVWDNKEKIRPFLYKDGDTGEWYQVLFMSLSTLGDADLLAGISKVFTVVGPEADKELEVRASKARWTAYKNYQILEIDELLNTAKNKAKAQYDEEVAIIRQKWSEAAAATKEQLANAEQSIRDMKKDEITENIRLSFLQKIANQPANETQQIVQYSARNSLPAFRTTKSPDDFLAGTGFTRMSKATVLSGWCNGIL